MPPKLERTVFAEVAPVVKTEDRATMVTEAAPVVGTFDTTLEEIEMRGPYEKLAVRVASRLQDAMSIAGGEATPLPPPPPPRIGEIETISGAP